MEMEPVTTTLASQTTGTDFWRNRPQSGTIRIVDHRINVAASSPGQRNNSSHNTEE